MGTELELVSPESVGIASHNVMRFLDRAEHSKICLHSFLILRHGKLCAEGYWKPFTKDSLHRLYSVSKTFVSAAIGILSDEGKISLDDKVIRYFPDKLPQNIHPYVANMTIRNLLTMSTPYSEQTYKGDDMDWLATFFNTPPSHPAGTIFTYDTSGTYVLDVIVERVTGMSFMEYLREKLLKHIGFSEKAWCVKSPEGNSWGGSGVMATSRDLAKFALVFMGGGKYHGKQLISKEYVAAATTRQIDNMQDATGCRWNRGYGYQIWILDNGAFAFRGMGSQLAICIPEKDILFVCTADTQGSEFHDMMIYENLWSEIVEKATDILPENKLNNDALLKRCAELDFAPLHGRKTSPLLSEINNAVYTLDENPMKISEISVSIDGDCGTLNYVNPRGDKKLPFKLGGWLECGFPETHYSGNTINKPSNKEYRCKTSATWAEEDKLFIRAYIIDDYFGNLSVTLSFKDDNIGIYMHKTAEWFLNEYQGFACGKRR